jgi:hypothetical protein
MDDATDLAGLRRRFDALFRETMHRCIVEIKYRPSYVLAHLTGHDGVDTAIWLVSIENESSGFTRLWEEGRLDLSAEALVLLPEYAPLFPVELRRRAWDTLKAYDWKALAGVARP